MTQTASGLWDETLDADRLVPDAEADGLLAGGVDLHTHPGPSPFPRRMSILDAASDAATVGFRAIVCKSHHHSMQTDILALQSAGLTETGVQAFGGIALNRTVGGLNPYGVELALRMGGRVVWFPTISSTAHLEFHQHNHNSGFPVAGIPLRDNEPISVVGDDGALVPEAQDILSVIAAESAILNCGHLPADEIDVLIPAAIAAGVERIVVSHPDFIVGASPERVGGWCRQGANVEHCLAMVVKNPADGSGAEKVAAFLRETGVGHTIFSSDLGQKNNPLPITAYRRMVRRLLDAGTAEDDIRAMVGGNAAQLLFR
ncbi:DUF6282 family protein [Pseudonocardia adelaidensis]|uniref:DUF6282 family protein n=1 Tax=Pseudonocardia adelaidensis TaxID=648754 RepID=A0ABP9NN94_9PSEU